MVRCLLLLLQADPLIEGLRSADLESRETAGIALRKTGAASIPALRNAVKDADPEFATRAREILDRIRKDLAPGELDKLRLTLNRAKTIRLRFSGKGSELDKGKTVPVEYEGGWILGAGNRASLVFSSKSGDLYRQYLTVSDGEEVFLSQRQRDGKTYFKTPPDLRSQLVDLILRLGAHNASVYASGVMMGVTVDTLDLGKPDPDLAAARWIESDHVGPSLTDAVKMTDRWRLRSRLWCAASGPGLLKREVVDELWSNGAYAERGRFIESYEFALDVEIPPDRFEIPRKKY